MHEEALYHRVVSEHKGKKACAMSSENIASSHRGLKAACLGRGGMFYPADETILLLAFGGLGSSLFIYILNTTPGVSIIELYYLKLKTNSRTLIPPPVTCKL